MARRNPAAASDYEAWLAHIFDHPAHDPAWYFSDQQPGPRLTSLETTQFVTRMLLQCGQDLQTYTDAQVNQGLNYIFSPSCSNMAFDIRDGSFGLEHKLEALRAIGTLYTDCFAPRCASVLSQSDDPGANKLNAICYMFWDVTPLTYWPSPRKRKPAYDVIFGVLDTAIHLPNVACVESGLHGLGHLHTALPKRVERVVEKFLDEAKDLPAGLERYAKSAKRGVIL